MSIPESILQCDLAILSYHLYHQSVIWPLDPWYDVMTRGMSDRRVLFMEKVHALCDSQSEYGLRGPSSASFQGARSNRELDPVISRYDQLNPRLPAFTGTADGYISIKTPDYITDNIRTVEVAQYEARPNIAGAPTANRVIINEVCDYPNGTDHLIAFEGGHGLVEPTTEPGWSLMGYVLMRQDPNDRNVHDIHIAFRGSRSGGSLGRTVIQALGKRGNPDWVTDMANFKVENKWVSKVGKAGKGFSYALQTCFGTVYQALIRLNHLHGTPRKITVTGHSLGAAMAGQMALAMTNGRFSEYLVHALPNWPWSTLRYVGWAQPTCGSQAFSTNWALSTNGCFYWVKGDSVVTIGEGSSKGVQMASQHGGQSVMLEVPDGAKENPHEIYLARAAVVRDLKLAGYRDMDFGLDRYTPWAQFKSFYNMVEGIPSSYIVPAANRAEHITNTNIRSVLNLYRVTAGFQLLLGILGEVALDPKAYKKPKLMQFKKDRVTKANRAMTVAGGLSSVTYQNSIKEQLDYLVSEIAYAKEIQGDNTGKYLGLVLAVNTFSRIGNLTWQDLKSRKEIRECLEY